MAKKKKKKVQAPAPTRRTPGRVITTGGHPSRGGGGDRVGRVESGKVTRPRRTPDTVESVERVDPGVVTGGERAGVIEKVKEHFREVDPGVTAEQALSALTVLPVGKGLSKGKAAIQATKPVGKVAAKAGREAVDLLAQQSFQLRQLGIKATNNIAKNRKIIRDQWRAIGKDGLNPKTAGRSLRLPANSKTANIIVNFVRKNWAPILTTVVVADLLKDLAFQIMWGEDDKKDVQTSISIAYRDARLLGDEEATLAIDDIKAFFDSPSGFARMVEKTPFTKLTLTPRAAETIRRIGEEQSRMHETDLEAAQGEDLESIHDRRRAKDLQNVIDIENVKRETQQFISDNIAANRKTLARLQAEGDIEVNTVKRINEENERYWEEQRRLSAEAAIAQLVEELRIQREYWREVQIEQMNARINNQPSKLGFGIV